MSILLPPISPTPPKMVRLTNALQSKPNRGFALSDFAGGDALYRNSCRMRPRRSKTRREHSTTSPDNSRFEKLSAHGVGRRNSFQYERNGSARRSSTLLNS